MFHVEWVRTFLAVVDRGGFRAASQWLGISQSTLSARIRSLEASIGQPLFDRSNRTITLTSAGEAFVAPARTLISETERAVDAARNASDRLSGYLRIGFVKGAIDAACSSCINEFAAAHPDVEVSLISATLEDPDAGLAKHRCDVGFFMTPVATTGLGVLTVRTEPVGLLVAADGPFGGRESISEAEYLAQPIPRITVTDRSWAHFWSLSRHRRALPIHGAKVTDFDELFEAIACGFVVAPAIASLANHTDSRIRVVAINGAPTAEVVLGWHTTFANPIVDQFVRALKAQLPAIAHTRTSG
jgi:DNA-binding transcriptional LysR family regulator